MVDKYQTVAFDTNRYSVPRPFAFQMVTVKGYVDQVVIVARGQTVRDSHARSRERNTVVLDPLHYLATLGRKPGALDSAPVFRDWKLPAMLRRLPRRAGTATRPWHRLAAVRTDLQLLAEHPLRRVRDAVEACRQAGLIAAEAVIRRTQVLAAVEATTSACPRRRSVRPRRPRSTCRCPT